MIKNMIIGLSITINLVIGYFDLSANVFENGVQAGLQQATVELNSMIDNGQLLLPEGENLTK